MRGCKDGTDEKRKKARVGFKMKTCVDVIMAAETAKGRASASPRAAKAFAFAFAAWELAKATVV